MSTFTAINIAMSGLQAQQAALDVTGQNIANVNTPGYTRQQAVLKAVPPAPATPSTVSGVGALLGGGVEVASIRRMQSSYLQQQMQSAQSQVGYWNSAQSGLQQIQSALAPNTTSTLSSLYDNFFTAWQQLANQPDDATHRAAVQTAGSNLANAFNAAATQLQQVSSGITSSLTDDVKQLNATADQIAQLNGQISAALAAGQSRNDLQDTRDSLVSQLGTFAGATSLSTPGGPAIVNIAGRTLVSGTTAHHLQVTQANGGTQLSWADDGATASVANGEMAALVNVQNSVIPSYSAQLDTLVAATASAVNNLHHTGVTASGQQAGDFFTGTTAATMAISASVLADTGAIATTTRPNAPGDGSLASSIAALYQQPLVGTQTLNQSVQTLIGQIGNAVKSAGTNADANTAVQQQLTKQIQSESGVSLDEELTGMLTYQRAYEASARVISTSDQMLQTLIQSMT